MFRAEIREFLSEELTPEILARVSESGTSHDWNLHAALASRGWLAAALPKHFGGQGRSPEELAVLLEEMEIAGAPYDGLGVTMSVLAVLARAGQEYHHRTVIPALLRGEAIVSLGYSEPDAGSDVAAVATFAEPRDGLWVINGQKMFTSLAEESRWSFVLARTSRDLAKHRGLTFFLVPLDEDGVEVTPIRTFSGKRTNVVYYNDVVVSDDLRVGEVNGGWQVMLVALAFERGVVGGASYCRPLVNQAIQLASSVGENGQPKFTDPSISAEVARIAIDAEVASLLAARATWIATSGQLPGEAGAMCKLFATETFTRASSALMDMLGVDGLMEEASDGGWPRILHAFRFAPVTTVYGGTSEIQRNLIAERTLGLPRRPR